jgi:uncharacterized protein (DUF488 family)
MVGMPEGHGDATRRDGQAPLLTIGYGDKRSADEFFELLRRYGVMYLVDVRSRARSRFRPEFSGDALEVLARKAGVVYLFMGDVLGGFPTDPSCYTRGRVDYSKVRERDWFSRGVDRLEAAWRAGHRVAIMCAESQPERCHRSKLVGEALVARGVPVSHIDESGEVVTQHDALDRLKGGQGELFDVGLTSRKRRQPLSGPDQEVA